MSLEKTKRRNKPLTDKQKIDREYFIDELKNYSVDALKTIVHLMNNAFDNNVRMKCAMYILDKTLGKDFSVLENRTEHEREFIVTLRTEQNKNEVDTEWIEEQIKRAEADEWNKNEAFEEWENDVYTGEISIK